ncbi:hypothetical protein Tco_0226593 [Tanacetum coccineum]
MNGIVASCVSAIDECEQKGNHEPSAPTLPRTLEALGRLICWDGTESEPFRDLGIESPESPHVVASPILFPDSTPHVGHVEESEGSCTSSTGSTSSDSTTPLSPDHPLTRDIPVSVPSLRRTAHMAVSPYESSPSPSPTLPVWKRHRGTFELVLSVDSEADELGNEEDSLDSDSGCEGAEDEGPAAGDEDPGMRDEGFGLGEDEVVPKGQQQVASVVETTVEEPLGLGFRVLRRRELAAREDQRYSMFEVGQGSGSAPEPKRLERVSAFREHTLTTWTDPEDNTIYIDVPTYPPPVPPIQTPPLPDWTPGSLLISPSHSDVPSPVSSPLISLTVLSHVATPIATIPIDEDQFTEVGSQLELYEGILQDYTQHLDALPPTLFAEINRDVRELYTRSGAVKDEIFS